MRRACASSKMAPSIFESSKRRLGGEGDVDLEATVAECENGLEIANADEGAVIGRENHVECDAQVGAGGDHLHDVVHTLNDTHEASSPHRNRKSIITWDKESRCPRHECAKGTGPLAHLQKPVENETTWSGQTAPFRVSRKLPRCPAPEEANFPGRRFRAQASCAP